MRERGERINVLNTSQWLQNFTEQLILSDAAQSAINCTAILANQTAPLAAGPIVAGMLPSAASAGEWIPDPSKGGVFPVDPFSGDLSGGGVALPEGIALPPAQQVALAECLNTTSGSLDSAGLVAKMLSGLVSNNG